MIGIAVGILVGAALLYGALMLHTWLDWRRDELPNEDD
jgi:hypothetical protein